MGRRRWGSVCVEEGAKSALETQAWTARGKGQSVGTYRAVARTCSRRWKTAGAPGTAEAVARCDGVLLRRQARWVGWVGGVAGGWRRRQLETAEHDTTQPARGMLWGGRRRRGRRRGQRLRNGGGDGDCMPCADIALHSCSVVCSPQHPRELLAAGLASPCSPHQSHAAHALVCMRAVSNPPTQNYVASPGPAASSCHVSHPIRPRRPGMRPGIPAARSELQAPLL